MNAERCRIDCKEMGDVHKTLYGTDGDGGLVKKVGHKISWKSLGVVIAPLIMIIFGSVTYSMTAFSKEKDVRQKQDAKQSKAITELQKDMDYVKKSVDRIEKTQEKLPDLLKKAMQNALKDFKKHDK